MANALFPTTELTQADKILLAVEAEESRRSLKTFVREAWREVDPAPFVDGWCVDAICDHLTALTTGDIRFLLINIPPKHSKSTICSVLWPVWCWLQNPEDKFLCASYALNLTLRDNRKKRNLIESKWFQDRFSSHFAIVGDQNQKRFFENDHKGYHMAVSIGSGTTGEGGSKLLMDDPHAADEAHGDAERETALTYFRETWSNRMNDAARDVMMVVGQRIHQNDVSGYIISERPDWTHLNLPAQYETARKCTTIIGWADPRTEEGELLWPERFSDETLDKLATDLGPLGYSAQYGQNPVPPGGYVFKMENERLFTTDHEAGLYLLETPQGIKSVPIAECWTCTTSDVAIKVKEQNDFTVFETWAITPKYDVLLLEVRREHWTFPQQKEQAKKCFLAWNSHTYTSIHFEDVGYQSAIGQDLIEEGVPCQEFVPKGDKLVRATGASIWQGAGKVYFLKHAHWLEMFRKEIYLFPMTKHDDQVDPLSMICMIVRVHAPLSDHVGYGEVAPVPEEEKQPTIVEVYRTDPFEYATARGMWEVD